MTRSLRHVLAGILGAAVLAAPAPVAAQMTEDQIGRTIAGIVALGIIAKAIDDRNDRRRAATREREDVLPSQRAGRFASRRDWSSRRDWRDERGHRRNDRRHLDWSERARTTPLPGKCLVRIDGRRHDRTGYDAACLAKRFEYSWALPRACVTHVRDRRGWDAVYGTRCLARDGWRVARR